MSGSAAISSTPESTRRQLNHSSTRIQPGLAADYDLKQRFLFESPGVLADHELVGLILSGVMPGVEIGSIVEALMVRYQTLGATVGAPALELSSIPGLGRKGATALKLVQAAAVSMLRNEVAAAPVLQCWDQLIDYLSVNLKHERVECFHGLFLDARGGLIADEALNRGTVNAVTVFPREVVRRCLELRAVSLIVVHNHPSGDPTPSRADVIMTLTLQRAAAIMGIILHDHVVVSRFGCRSFRQEKLIGVCNDVQTAACETVSIGA